MTKQQSQILKGVAILLMIFLHLFNHLPNVEMCHNFIYIDGLPLVYILSRATNPVAFFLILGGYGIYKVNERGVDKHRFSRIIKLFIHYWIILAIFVAIGHFISPQLYPGSFGKIIANVTSFHTTYNGEMWFLFPYALLSLIAPFLFKIMNRFKAWHVVAVTFAIYLCTSFCISRYGVAFLYKNVWAYNPLLVLHLLFSFTLGAMAARTHFFERLKQAMGGKKYTTALAWGTLIVLVIVNCLFKYNFFYAFMVISCLILIPMKGVFKQALTSLGTQSMNMWMIHSWFCYYLFRDFIYSFSYPILIFAVLTAISYCCSLIVNMIAKPIEKKLMTKAELNAKSIL